MNSEASIETSVIVVKEEPIDYENIGDNPRLMSIIEVEETQLEFEPDIEETSKNINRIAGPKSKQYRHKMNSFSGDDERNDTLISLVRPCFVILHRIKDPDQEETEYESQSEVEDDKEEEEEEVTSSTEEGNNNRASSPNTSMSESRTILKDPQEEELSSVTNINQNKIRKYSLQSLQDAITSVQDDRLSIIEAAKQYNIPRRTLYEKIYYIRKEETNQRTMYKKAHIPEFIEIELVKYCKQVVDHGLPLHNRDVADVIEKIINLEQFARFIRPFKNGKPSKSWINRFFWRHPEIKMVDGSTGSSKQKYSEIENNENAGLSDSDVSDCDQEPELVERPVEVKIETSKTKKTAKRRQTKKKEKVPSIKKVTQINIHKCKACRQIFSSAGKLDVHNLSFHPENRQFKCSKCSYAAKTTGNLSMHLMNIHGTNKYYCDLCDLKFKSRRNIYGHMIRIHFQPKRKR